MLPRNAGNANESLTQTGALPPGALHLLIRLQNSLRKAPLCSAPARVCHLPSAQTWWPQPDLDALIPRAVNGWGLKGMQLISPQPAWLPLTTTRGWRRPVSLPLSTSPATKYVLTGDINLRCHSLEICIANSRLGDISPLGAEPEASSPCWSYRGRSPLCSQMK